MVRKFHLSLPGTGHGVSCDAEGAFIGVVPVLRRLRKNDHDEWQPRDCEELSDEIAAHYGLPIDISPKTGGLKAIANALNERNVARAQIATVLLGIPDPPRLSKNVRSREEMIKLIRDLHWSGLIKEDWDPNEHPRWPALSPDGVGGDFAPKGEGDIDPSAEALRAAVAEAARERDRDAPSLQRHFEQKYDNLGPADFSKQVIQFGYWLETHGKSLSPAARSRALAEYDFVQGRLVFWQSYPHKSPAAGLWMISAADLLYQGAINGGIEHADHIPPSMAAVFGEAWGLEGGRSHIPSARAASVQPIIPEEGVERFELPGGIVDNGKVRSGWGKGLMQQSGGWEDFINEQYQTNKLLRNAKTFDHFDASTGAAISDKTLNTQTFNYINNPQKIYQRLKGYTDAVAAYSKPRVKTDVDPNLIKSKAIQLAIPEFTSPAQWPQIYRAIRYAKGRGVSVVVTRICD